MAGLRALLRPLNRQLRLHVEEVTLPRLDDRLDHLSGQIEDVRTATVEVRRFVTDDLDASNEASALLGRALAGLTDAMEQLRGEVSALREEMTGLRDDVAQLRARPGAGGPSAQPGEPGR